MTHNRTLSPNLGGGSTTPTSSPKLGSYRVNPAANPNSIVHRKIPTFIPKKAELQDDLKFFEDRMQEILKHYQRPKWIWRWIFYILGCAFIGVWRG